MDTKIWFAHTHTHTCVYVCVCIQAVILNLKMFHYRPDKFGFNFSTDFISGNFYIKLNLTHIFIRTKNLCCGFEQIMQRVCVRVCILQQV